jgi:ATP-binding cassette subfamily C protein CydD
MQAEQKLGNAAARQPIAFGAAQIFFGILQAACAAQLLAGVLHLAPRGLGLAGFALGFAICAVFRAWAGLRAERLGFEAGAAARRRLRNSVLGTLLDLGPAGLAGRHSAELATTAVDRVEAMEGFHARWIAAAALGIIGPVLVGLAVLLVDWRSFRVLAIAGLAVPVALAISGAGGGAAVKNQFLAMSRLQTLFLDRIRGISTIVLAGRAGDEAIALAAAARELRTHTMRVLRIVFLGSTVLDLAAAASLIFIVLRFSAVLHGNTSLAPTALFALLLVPEFFAPLRAFSAVYADRKAAETVAGEFAALPAAPASVPPAEIRSVAAHGLTLAFDHVSFAWDPARGPVLENLSFRVNSGEILLLTGASGTGKSTILDLILGFITPDSGRVTINGVDLPVLVPAARTRMLGWIGQKPVIFAGTIEENIRFAKPEASTDELAEAIRLARLSDLIAALPQGLKTPLGEGGFGLSGGQAQRIAIARAFLKDAPLLLLDEPTAHLDPAIERDVLDSIKRLATGRTVILATHSTAAMEFARNSGARRLDLDALRHARLRGVA